MFVQKKETNCIAVCFLLCILTMCYGCSFFHSESMSLVGYLSLHLRPSKLKQIKEEIKATKEWKTQTNSPVQSRDALESQSHSWELKTHPQKNRTSAKPSNHPCTHTLPCPRGTSAIVGPSSSIRLKTRSSIQCHTFSPSVSPDVASATQRARKAEPVVIF